MQLDLTRITFEYPLAPAPILTDVTVTFPTGWTGIVGDNGCGKTTLASIACRQLLPTSGTVTSGLFSTYCAQDSTLPPENLFDFASDWSKYAIELRNILSITDDQLWRYESLSGGQQKRIQIACSLIEHPDVLVMDEPTNELDILAKAAVTEALRSFTGIGILISHDRCLLDALIAQCLIFEGKRCIMRPGTYTQAAGQAQADHETAAHERQMAKQEVKRLKAEATRRRAEADKSSSMRSARKLDKHDSSAREAIGRAIVSGKDGVSAKLSSRMNSRLAKAEDKLNAATTNKRYVSSLKAYGNVFPSATLWHLNEGVIKAGEFTLTHPELWISPTDHIVLHGENGCGKSTLVRELVAKTPDELKFAYLPQEVDVSIRIRALDRLAQLTNTERGCVFSIIANLNSQPERLLNGEDASPGEVKKLLLALQLIQDPHALILDEPTNHLDMGSADALGELLNHFTGAYLLVTHDEALSDSLAAMHWRIKKRAGMWRLNM